MNKVYVIGIGPGGREGLTIEATEAIEQCDILVGYQLYAELLKETYPDKEYYVNGMRQEAERCRKALEMASAGRTVGVICSGDSGVYGMAGLLFELSVEFSDVQVEVIPGVTAALSGGAMLGAPLGHDFAVISLSDLLTPWELIEKRLRLAGEADLCLCLYNPGSRKRSDYLKKAAEILLASRPESQIAGYVRNIGRDGAEVRVMTLGELKELEADMMMTVFIGNSSTRLINGKMVTPRGYKI